MDNKNFSDPFKSTTQQKTESQNKEQVKITKDELVAEYETLKEPYNFIEKPKPSRLSPKKTFEEIWYEVLTEEIQKITDGLEKANDTTSQNELARIKELIRSVKIRLNANAKGDGKSDLFILE